MEVDQKLLDGLLCDYIKVIRINVPTGTFKEVKIPDDEKVSYNGVNQWFIQFAISSKLPDNERKVFLENANLGTIVDKLKNSKEMNFIYHRKVDNDIKWMKMQCRYIDKDEILLTIRDISINPKPIENISKADIIEQFKSFESSHASVGLALIEFKPEEEKEFYNIMKKYYESCYPTIKYDSTHYIVYTLDKTRQEAFPLAAQLYENLSSIDVTIGYVWSDEDWNFASLLAKAATNLQVNK